MAKGGSKTMFSRSALKVGKGGGQTTFSRGAVKVGPGGAQTVYGSGSASKSKPSLPRSKTPSGSAVSGPSNKASAGKADRDSQSYRTGVPGRLLP
jgi:hypothetical protein